METDHINYRPKAPHHVYFLLGKKSTKPPINNKFHVRSFLPKSRNHLNHDMPANLQPTEKTLLSYSLPPPQFSRSFYITPMSSVILKRNVHYDYHACFSWRKKFRCHNYDVSDSYLKMLLEFTIYY